MTISEKIGRLFLIGIKGTELTEETKALLDKIQPGFIILFQRNIQSKEQLKCLVCDIKKYVNRPIVFAIDQEGGIVTRLDEGFTISPGAMAISATNNPQNAFMAGKILGQEMRALGITWNLAPVVDINDNYLNRSMGVRAFGDTVERVCEFSKAFYKGLKESGCAASAKHFPGSGSIEVDPHLDMPVLNKLLDELMDHELIPFKQLIDKGIESVMISHVYLPEIMKNKVPSVISSEVMQDILIKLLKFKGVLISDDLTMGGVANFYNVEEASYHALMAGMDVIDICHDGEKMIRAHNYLIEQASKNQDVMETVNRSFDKVDLFIKRFSVPVSEINTDHVGSNENINQMQQITDQTITVYKNEDQLVPLPQNIGKGDLICSVKPLRQSLVEDERSGTYVSAFLQDRFPEAEQLRFDAKITEEAVDELTKDKTGRTAVIMTENAYLFPGQKKLVQLLRDRYNRVLLIALRNPYDGGISGIRNSVFSYGYSLPNQKALIKVLRGEIKAQGRCPVQIPTIN
jgi:beta-N-acetylhexosaminidase